MIKGIISLENFNSEFFSADLFHSTRNTNKIIVQSNGKTSEFSSRSLRLH